MSARLSGKGASVAYGQHGCYAEHEPHFDLARFVEWAVQNCEEGLMRDVWAEQRGVRGLDQ